jgi:hypothetical protein
VLIGGDTGEPAPATALKPRVLPLPFGWVVWKWVGVRLGFGGEDTLLGPEETSVVSSGAFLILWT